MNLILFHLNAKTNLVNDLILGKYLLVEENTVRLLLYKMLIKF